MSGKSVFSTPYLDKQKKIQDYLKNNDKVLRPNTKKASTRKVNEVNAHDV
tara:strand:+ start:2244 stop:2393 length:150 start_codon:yes stop_codon:yes gene_type:complete